MQCCNLFIFELTKSRDGVDMHDIKSGSHYFFFSLAFILCEHTKAILPIEGGYSNGRIGCHKRLVCL